MNVYRRTLISRGSRRSARLREAYGARVTTVGGAGHIARVVARDLLARRNATELVLADRDVAKAQRVAAALVCAGSVEGAGPLAG